MQQFLLMVTLPCVLRGSVLAYGLFFVLTGSIGLVFSEEQMPAFPQQWMAFGPYENGLSLPGKEQLLHLKEIPENLTINGTTRKGHLVAIPDKMIDFEELFKVMGDGADGTPLGVYLMGEISCHKSQTFAVGCGADWWMSWYLDGVPVFSTLPSGNGQWSYACDNHVFICEVPPGRHILTVFVISGSQGWKLFFDKGEKYLELNRVAKQRGEEEQKWRARLIEENARVNSRMKLMIYGSSVAGGAGAPRGEGWADKLATALRARNWIVVNRSIGGDNTEKLLARFACDVLPEHPDAMLIALSLANEGLLMGEAELVYQKYMTNMRKLIQLCQKNGIIPIIGGCYPNNSYQESHYNYILKFNEALGGWPVASLNFLSAVDDGAGRWAQGTDKDAGHPNKTGHAEMFTAIPLGLFDALIDGTTWGETICPSLEHWFAPRLETVGYTYRPDHPLHNFTAVFSLSTNKYPIQEGVIFMAGDIHLRLLADGAVVLLQNSRELLRISSAVRETGACVIGLSRRYLSAEIALMANGTVVTASALAADEIDLCSIFQPSGVALQDVALYRSALDNASLRATAFGNYPRSSLDVFAPLNDAYIFEGMPVINRAPSGGQLIVDHTRQP